MVPLQPIRTFPLNQFKSRALPCVFLLDYDYSALLLATLPRLQQAFGTTRFDPDPERHMKNRIQSLIHLTIFSMIGTAWISQTSAQENWPQWRGGDLRSISSELNLPVKFDKDTNLAWRFPLPGTAGSSPVVWEDRVFVTSADDDNMVLYCVGTDGKQQWKKLLDGKNTDSRDNANSASPSPSTDGEHVWCMMGDGIIYCFTVDGELVWKKDLQQEYGKFNIQFGMSTTPILDNGNLYVALMHGNMRDTKTTSVGQVIAFDAKTGNEIWLHLRKTDGVAENTHSYASPTIYRDKNREFLVTHGADYVIGHSLEDGAELWRCGGFNPKGQGYNNYLRFVASPGCGEGIIVVPTAKRKSMAALKVDIAGNVTEDKSAFHWKLERGTPDVSTPLIYDGLVYLAGEKGDLAVHDAKTGKLHYRERLLIDKQRATPVAANGKIYFNGRDGTVVVIKAGETLEILAENKLNEELTSSPAMSNGVIYIRTFEAIYAFKNDSE
ncbi:MAG: outer membrane protein assembly factor BamB [Mariniblastus sp.]|jgi:outer membrane protein assembly factor BamB